MDENQDFEEFTLTLSGTGIDIRRVVSRQKAAIIMNVILGLEPATSESAIHIGQQADTTNAGKISLREFLDKVAATKKSDQIVAIGQYMAIYEGLATFSRDDVKARFPTAREPLPKNFPRDFGTAIKAGMIAEDHKQAGQYYVTKTGIQAIERHFKAPKNS